MYNTPYIVMITAATMLIPPWQGRSPYCVWISPQLATSKAQASVFLMLASRSGSGTEVVPPGMPAIPGRKSLISHLSRSSGNKGCRHHGNNAPDAVPSLRLQAAASVSAAEAASQLALDSPSFTTFPPARGSPLLARMQSSPRLASVASACTVHQSEACRLLWLLACQAAFTVSCGSTSRGPPTAALHGAAA